MNKKLKSERNKRYYCKHKQEIIKQRKQHLLEHGLEHKKHRAILDARFYLNHKQEIKNNHKNYLRIHQEQIRKRDRDYRKQKRNTNINFKLKCYLRTRIYHVLKGINKSASTEKLVGCSLEFLKQHLEKQFKLGMSFSNYGKWHIDHIKPCASYDLSKPEEQKKCFNYSNLQPLWAEENLSKHDKY